MPAHLRPPFAASDGASNLRLNDSNKALFIRFVPRHTGILSSIWLKAKTNNSDGPSYAAGGGGTVEAKLTTINPDGTPNESGGTIATLSFPANGATKPSNSDTNDNTFRIDVNSLVIEGREYGLIIRNTVVTAASDYFSINFSYATSPGGYGAQGRNEMNPRAGDTYYGLDPREVVGGSADKGVTWVIPGSPADPANKNTKQLPVYILVFADGKKQAQEFYSGTLSYSAGVFNQTFTGNKVPWSISYLGFYLAAGLKVATTMTVVVNGVSVATVNVKDPTQGFNYVPLPVPVVAPIGSTVVISLRADPAGISGLPLRQLYSDTQFDQQLGKGAVSRWYIQEAPQFTFPVWPLPYHDLSGVI